VSHTGPEPADHRRALIVASATGAAIVVAVALLLPRIVDQARQADAPTPEPGAADLAAVELYDDVSREHLDDGVSIDYPENPPVGGSHDEAWLDCDTYLRPVREENAVHSLEHGAIWITYEPGLTRAERQTLAAALPEKGILSPFGEDMEAPVVVTAWATQLLLDGPDDPRLTRFVEVYGDAHTAPEASAACEGGVRRFEAEDQPDDE
jgi:hypothetical protein